FYQLAPPPPPPLRPPPNPPNPPPNPLPPPPQPPPPPNGPTPLDQPLHGPPPQNVLRRRRPPEIRLTTRTAMKIQKMIDSDADRRSGCRHGCCGTPTPSSVTPRPCAMRPTTRSTPSRSPSP